MERYDRCFAIFLLCVELVHWWHFEEQLDAAAVVAVAAVTVVVVAVAAGLAVTVAADEDTAGCVECPEWWVHFDSTPNP